MSWLENAPWWVRLILDPSRLQLLGLIGVLLFSAVALAGFIWQQFRTSQTIQPQIGPSGVGPQTSTTLPDQSKAWTENARLTITFDNELQAASASRQEGVRFYYWYNVPAVAIEWKTRQISTESGYMMVFSALADPTSTNYSRVRVIGGGIQCEVLSTHPAGAVIRAMGDMRGRALDVWFSKNPIPFD
jgi:hypothetical protein